MGLSLGMGLKYMNWTFWLFLSKKKIQSWFLLIRSDFSSRADWKNRSFTDLRIEWVYLNVIPISIIHTQIIAVWVSGMGFGVQPEPKPEPKN